MKVKATIAVGATNVLRFPCFFYHFQVVQRCNIPFNENHIPLLLSIQNIPSDIRPDHTNRDMMSMMALIILCPKPRILIRINTHSPE
jgi:hypothetical protein